MCSASWNTEVGNLNAERLEAVKAAVDDGFDGFVAELRDLCQFDSRRENEPEMLKTAEWVAESVRRHGGEADVIPWAASHPYVLASWAGGPRRLLHFTHYDIAVEPTGDDSEWRVPPYSGAVVDGRMYARGIADDKGAIMSRIHAVEAFHSADVPLPVGVRLICEGKKWVHSPGLPSFFTAHRDQLAADAAIWENAWTDSAGRPLLKLGEKGFLYLEASVRALSRELTSQNSALLPNAAWRLVWALSSLKSPDGRVIVDGFYEGVRKPSPEEMRLLADVEFGGEFLRSRAGVAGFLGGVSDREAALLVRTQPTLTIGGIEGGNLADDVTLGLPATARAKLEIRLVADQDPEAVTLAIRRHLDARGFSDVALRTMAATRPRRTPPDHPFVRLVADAARRVYGKEPVVEPYTTWLGHQSAAPDIPIVGLGVSRYDSGPDGPNEFITLEDYRQGVKHIVEVMAALSET